MKFAVSLLAFAYALSPANAAEKAQPSHAAGPLLLLIEEGQPRAEIVVAPKRPRMATLAALELRLYLEKISGARLPIVTAPSPAQRAKIYVGKGAGTGESEVASDDLKFGAYRIASGPGRLVLIGNDFDFAPPEPSPKKRKDVPAAVEEWEKLTAGKTVGWGFPFASTFKANWDPSDWDDLLTSRYGTDAMDFWKGSHPDKNGFWEHDGGGTLNAVYGLLRHLGTRWFMPGELGEVIPKRVTVEISPINETVTPAFPVRNWNYYNFSGFSFDDVIYARQSGMNSGFEKLGLLFGPHGLTRVTSHPAMKKAHPDYYALIGGQRDTEHRGQGTPNFMSDGLVAETANYIRFMFDEYDMPLVDIWPTDGLRLSQDEASAGKSASELVWGFADRVAREVYKTHPDKLVGCGAYTSYVDPPDSISKFSPNLLVQIANCARPLMEDPEHWAKYQRRIKSWRERIAPGNILRLENNRYHIWGDGAPIVFPVIHPRGIAKDLKAMDGISLGDTGEQSQRATKWSAIGLNHINLYVQARFLWDPHQDLDALLDDYFTQFYGPASDGMKEAFTYAEVNLARKDQSRTGGRANPANAPLAASIRFRELLEIARQKAGAGIYGQRIDLIRSELEPKDTLIAQYRERQQALDQARAKAPLATGVAGSDLSKAATYTLKDNQGGKVAAVETSFRVGWSENAVLFDILCKDPNMDDLQVSKDVHGGNYVAVSLATPEHSYYHLEINPDGVSVEGNPGPNWKSLADIKTERGPDFWRVQLRIPVVGQEEANSDPHHRVAGEMPTPDKPWFFNVGRSRPTGTGTAELQAFSPTRRGWHLPEKFGKLEIK